MVALVRDLMFAARVRGAAPDARTANGLPALMELVGPGTRLVIVDAQAPDAVEAVQSVRDTAPDAELVAFGPHVEEAALQALSDAGADRVLPRGRFVRELPTLVRGL